MICQFFHVRVDFYYRKDRDSNKLDDELLDIVKDAYRSEIFTGNPACGPYITAEYADRRLAGIAERKLIDHLKLKRHKVIS